VVLQQQQQLLAQHLSSAPASAAPAPASVSPSIQANVQKKQVQSLLEQIALLTGQKQLVSEAVLEVCMLTYARTVNAQSLRFFFVACNFQS
jgi:hypothetical protein